MLNLMTNRTLLISKHNASYGQNRMKIERKGSKHNTRNIKSIIDKTQIAFMEDFQQNLEIKIDSLSRISSGSLDSKDLSPLLQETEKNMRDSIKNKENSKENLEISPLLKNSMMSLKGKSALIRSKRSKKLTFQENNDIDKEKITSLKYLDEEYDSFKGINNAKSMEIEPNLGEITLIHTDVKNLESMNHEKMKELEKSTTLTRRNHQENAINYNNMLDFERMKQFSKYQPNFNYNVVIMLINKEFYYRMKRKAKKKSMRNKMRNSKLIEKKAGNSQNVSVRSRFSIFHKPIISSSNINNEDKTAKSTKVSSFKK